ncbi:MAG: alpha-amylase family glycosyl hydrolase [Syntrophobacteria bacterium]|jgi:starch synthase (maltosyl-transferring)
MQQPGKMIIYNLFPLLAGRFGEWGPHLSRAAEMGFNWIFVNPIQRSGSSGSLYSVADYYSFNPLLVDQETEKSPYEQIQETIGTARRLGLKMMVDLVINHCAVDSDLIKEHPGWFVWEAEGRVAHPFCYDRTKKVVWRDLAKFDHKNSRDKEGLFRFFLEVVKYLIDLGFEGFRCDAAYQVPASVWQRLIGETKELSPDVCFLAETLGSTAEQTRKTASAGFDYIFNSSKWWDFTGHWLMAQYNLTREIAPSISFPESHDTTRLFEEINGNVDGLKQRYLFSALFSSGVMMPLGFEFGFRKKPHVVKTRPTDWEKTGINLTHYIEKVNRLKERYGIFREEAPTEVLTNSNSNVLVVWKASMKTREESLLILNKDIDDKQRFYAESLQEYVQAGAPLVDVSPEYSLAYIPTPFSYDLLPGQGIVLVTVRDAVLDD